MKNLLKPKRLEGKQILNRVWNYPSRHHFKVTSLIFEMLSCSFCCNWKNTPANAGPISRCRLQIQTKSGLEQMFTQLDGSISNSLGRTQRRERAVKRLYLTRAAGAKHQRAELVITKMRSFNNYYEVNTIWARDNVDFQEKPSKLDHLQRNRVT